MRQTPGQTWSISSQALSIASTCWSNSAERDPTPLGIVPTMVDSGPLAGVGRICPQLGQIWPSFHCIRPVSAPPRRNLSRIRPHTGNFDQVWPDFGKYQAASQTSHVPRSGTLVEQHNVGTLATDRSHFSFPFGRRWQNAAARKTIKHTSAATGRARRCVQGSQSVHRGRHASTGLKRPSVKPLKVPLPRGTTWLRIKHDVA